MLQARLKPPCQTELNKQLKDYADPPFILVMGELRHFGNMWFLVTIP